MPQMNAPILNVLQRDLSVAATEGRVGPLKLLLRAGASPDGVPGGAIRPLCQALAAGQPECVEALIQGGASVEARLNDAGGSPVSLAASMCDERSLDALLKAGADVNERLAYGGSAFLIALLSDNDWGLQMLANRGALPLPREEVKRAFELAAGSPAALRAKALWEAVELSDQLSDTPARAMQRTSL